MATVPNVVGLDITQPAAQDAVVNAGLTCGTNAMIHTGSTNYKITSQTPVAGTTVDAGTAVNVIYYNSRPIPPPTVIWGH